MILYLFPLDKTDSKQYLFSIVLFFLFFFSFVCMFVFFPRSLTPSLPFEGNMVSIALSYDGIGNSDKINVYNTEGCKGAEYQGKILLVIIVG